MNKTSKYCLEIDCNGAEASGFEDRLPWVCYGTIIAEGNTLEECLESATVDLVDQDGGEAGHVEADAGWMQSAVERAFMDKYRPDGSLRIWTRVVLSFDETKPHWAKQQGLDQAAEALGLRRIRVTGDFDSKLALIYGVVEDYAAFAFECERHPALKHGTLALVAGTSQAASLLNRDGGV